MRIDRVNVKSIQYGVSVPDSKKGQQERRQERPTMLYPRYCNGEEEMENLA
jgi:hypothetical protein